MRMHSFIYFRTRWLISVLLLLWCGFSAAQNSAVLKFRQGEPFKIVQFTDVHLDNTQPNCAETASVIKHVLAAEKPDLIILTGDIVTYSPAAEGWDAIAAIMSESGIPWAVTLGNHDDEPGLSRSEIFDLLEPKKGFIGQKGPEEISGTGNYILEIKASDSDKTSALIYCIDSHSYPEDKKLGSYDWVRFDQIEWYRKQSRKFTKANGGNPLPALAYFHIPTPEYKEVYDSKSSLGEKNEGVASPLLNSGLITSMIEMGDVMGTFTGHDHENNYIALYHSLALAYGQVTGVNAYGKFERGARVVEISEGAHSFNTWIRTNSGVSFPYNFPFGGTYDESAYDFLKAEQLSDMKPGISYSYFEGTFKSTDDFAGVEPVHRGVVQEITLEPRQAEDHFGFEFNAWIEIPEKGLYRFSTWSDDGSRLYIGGKLVVDNDGSHSARLKEGAIALEKGFHRFRLLYFDDYMGETLEAGISGLTFREKPVTGAMLFIPENKNKSNPQK